MKTIKGRFLRTFKSIPSKQHIFPLPFGRESQERLSSNQVLQKYTQQEDGVNTNVGLETETGHIMSSDDSLAPTKEVDVFEDCECGFESDDSMPEMVSSSSSSSSSTSPARHKDSEDTANLQSFLEKCPPGGGDKVILYTTSLRGIRKTYEDCSAVKFLLDSFRVVYFERDVSLHLKFRDELWDVLESRVVPPKLFIKGRYIGGANEVVTLHENEMLKKLLQGMPVYDLTVNLKCCQCGGVRFLLCSDCSGSCKVYRGDDHQGSNNNNDDGDCLFVRCSKCNENGLIKCPTCSY